MTRLIGLAPQTLVDLSPLELVDCAASAGFDLVGLRLQPATSADRAWPIIGRSPMIEEMRLRLDDSGLRVLDVEILRLAPETRVADFEVLLETAAYLGAEQLLVVGNDPDRSRLSANLWALAELSESYGLTPNVEFMPWTAVPTVVDAAALVASTTHPNTGIVVDPIHLDRSGGSAADLAAMPAGFFHYVQLCDAPAEWPLTLPERLVQARDDRLLPGRGELPVAEVLNTLPAGIPATLEAPVLALAAFSPLERARIGFAAAQEFLYRSDGS